MEEKSNCEGLAFPTADPIFPTADHLHEFAKDFAGICRIADICYSSRARLI